MLDPVSIIAAISAANGAFGSLGLILTGTV